MTRHLRIILFLLILGCIVSASAHVPLDTGEHTPANAVLIPDPTKSWVIYERLDGPCDARHYALDLKEGEELRVSVFVTDPETLPLLIVSGPDIEPAGKIPGCIETADPDHTRLIETVLPEKAEYEPFTPEAIYPVGRYSKIIETPGYYYVTIAGSEKAGNVGIAPGYVEKFAPVEWIMIPLLTAGVHVWEGQPVLVVLLPLLLTIACGFVLIGRRWLSLLPWNKCAIFASFFYIGGAAMVVLQIIIALIKTGWTSMAFITIFFVIIQLLLGFIILRTGRSTKKATWKTVIVLFTVGILGFVVWAGLIIGPVISIMAGTFSIYDIIRHKQEQTGEKS